MESWIDRKDKERRVPAFISLCFLTVRATMPSSVGWTVPFNCEPKWTLPPESGFCQVFCHVDEKSKRYTWEEKKQRNGWTNSIALQKPTVYDQHGPQEPDQPQPSKMGINLLWGWFSHWLNQLPPDLLLVLLQWGPSSQQLELWSTYMTKSSRWHLLAAL